METTQPMYVSMWIGAETITAYRGKLSAKYLVNSHHPRSHKKSVVTTLFQRAENLTSNNDARENECQYVTNILKKNNYPKSFLHDCLRRPTLTDCNSPEGDSAVKGFAIVPYIQGIAEPIRRVLNNCGIYQGCPETLSDIGTYFCETQGSHSDWSENTCCILYTMRWLRESISGSNKMPVLHTSERTSKGCFEF